MAGGRYTTFWRALAAGLLLGSVMVASVLLSHARDDSSRTPGPKFRDAALTRQPPRMRARGCTDTWLKTASTEWTIAANWSAGRVPTPADRVCIPDGAVAWLHGNATLIASIAAEGTLSLTDHAALVLDNPSHHSSIETLVLNQSKIGGRSPLAITGTFDMEDGSELAGPARITIAKRAEVSFDPGPGGKATVRAPVLINGSFDVASGALYVGAEISDRGFMNVRYASPTGQPAGLLALNGQPLKKVVSPGGRDLQPGEPVGTTARPPLAGR